MFYNNLIKLYRVIYILYKLVNCECDIKSNNNYSVNNVFNKLLIDL
jgi:hypothetical protein